MNSHDLTAKPFDILDQARSIGKTRKPAFDMQQQTMVSFAQEDTAWLFDMTQEKSGVIETTVSRDLDEQIKPQEPVIRRKPGSSIDILV